MAIDAGIMHIGELAEATGMSLRTLRHYDQIGLLKPSGRSEGGFRLYTQPDMDRVMLIRRMKPLGFSLQQMADLLHLVGEPGADGSGDADRDGDERLSAFIADVEQRRERLQRELAMADDFLRQLRRQQAATRRARKARASTWAASSGSPTTAFANADLLDADLALSQSDR